MAKLSRKEINRYVKFAQSLYDDIIDVSVSVAEDDENKVILKITRGCVLPDIEINREAELPDCIIKQ